MTLTEKATEARTLLAAAVREMPDEIAADPVAVRAYLEGAAIATVGSILDDAEDDDALMRGGIAVIAERHQRLMQARVISVDQTPDYIIEEEA